MLNGCAGVLFTAILEDTGFNSTSLSLFFSIRQTAEAIIVIGATKLMMRMEIRKFMQLCVTVIALAFGLMSVYTNVYCWWISALLSAFSISVAMGTVSSVLRNWFHERIGLALGICSASAGVFGAVFNPILSALISRLGWRNAILVFAISSFMLGILSSQLLIRRTPEEMGERPYGEKKTMTSTSVEEENDINDIFTKEAAKREDTAVPRVGLKTDTTYLIVFLCVFSGSMATALIHFLSQFSASLGNALGTGAALTSAAMIGNSTAKFSFGALCDRIGVWKTLAIQYLAIIISLTMLCIANNRMFIMAIAGFLLGGACSFPTVGLHALCIEMFGNEEFEKPCSRLTAFNSFGMTLEYCLIPVIYEATNSYYPSFVITIGLCMFSLSMVVLFGWILYRRRMVKQ